MDLPTVFFHGATLAFQRDDLGKEIMGIAVPGALALMADPLASLVDTAFIGHIDKFLRVLNLWEAIQEVQLDCDREDMEMDSLGLGRFTTKTVVKTIEFN